MRGLSKIKKEDGLNRQNTILNDKVIEVTTRFEKIDEFYQTIIEQKDKTINEYMEITEEYDSIDSKFKRLLSYHKAQKELVNMQQINSSI